MPQIGLLTESRRSFAPARSLAASMPTWRLVVCVLLPFAAGFHLSYLFRTINALIAGDLAKELGLGAADLGLLTSAYFLMFGAAQIPCGILLDRHGPKVIQSALLLVAGAGALVFAMADSMILLVIGRGLIGLGVALALMAGLKAIVLWFPTERLALVNGWLMMLGTLGAVTATAPAELLIDRVGWRGLFVILAALSGIAALLVLILVPEPGIPKAQKSSSKPIGIRDIYRDRRFWQIAPLSALGIGTSWALQGLWAAPWLRDVDGLDRSAIVDNLGIMALVLSVSGLLLGLTGDRLRRAGVRTDTMLGCTIALSIVAQIALVLDWPLPPIVPWSLIALAGVATVLGYTVLAEFFPKHASGRANGALNLLQVGAAFAVQSAFGAIIALWEPDAGRYPPEAYRTALVFFIGLQIVALGWFATAATQAAQGASTMQRTFATSPGGATEAYLASVTAWALQRTQARRHLSLWRAAAATSATLLTVLSASVCAALLPESASGTQIAFVNSLHISATIEPGGLVRQLNEAARSTWLVQASPFASR